MQNINLLLKENKLPELERLRSIGRIVSDNKNHQVYKIDIGNSVPITIDLENGNFTLFFDSILYPWVEIFNDHIKDTDAKTLISVFTDNYILEKRKDRNHYLHFFDIDMKYKFTKKCNDFSLLNLGMRDMVFYKSLSEDLYQHL